MRICSWRDQAKSDTDFYLQKSGKFLSGCKACRRAYDTDRKRQGDPVQKSAKLREWRQQNPEKVRAHQRRQRLRRYGLTTDGYQQMLDQQSGQCAGCGNTSPGVGQNLYVDHDHQTGEVRGLLCHDCNSALGHAGDSVERLMALAAYLLKSSAKDYSD